MKSLAVCQESKWRLSEFLNDFVVVIERIDLGSSF